MMKNIFTLICLNLFGTTAFSQSNVVFFYACKALTNINVLKLVNQLDANLDCVSINEVKLGLMAGFAAKHILFTPNCVDFGEIEEAKQLGVNLNIDNISILEQFGNRYGNNGIVGWTNRR